MSCRAPKITRTRKALLIDELEITDTKALNLNNIPNTVEYIVIDRLSFDNRTYNTEPVKIENIKSIPNLKDYEINNLSYAIKKILVRKIYFNDNYDLTDNQKNIFIDTFFKLPYECEFIIYENNNGFNAIPMYLCESVNSANTKDIMELYRKRGTSTINGEKVFLNRYKERKHYVDLRERNYLIFDSVNNYIQNIRQFPL